ncbi:uncharacterized protein EDB91DRAFT_1251291 [Suillus paluster]|uniref:uncharacterized protein n=1 Tax=Suillus paluster TaxID=48578 RepID=UPI001B85F107|nr:uncharacterized protein EDB91DRAFT_1251291 [Suillus paluster]KAG1733634.1 hypothetical protein EDB91DRAFT_1251291 [Suillus paluster]
MESFTEDHSKFLLSKEWLVKVDSQSSTPYLFKFTYSSVDLTACILVTDTKTAWAEVLTSNQFARRWRLCNKLSISPLLDPDDEESWRDRHLTLLDRAHSLGGFQELTFDAAKPTLGDLALELECSNWKWRWEPTLLGPKISAEILSKHLIMPLISVNHLAFSSSDVLGDLTPGELEKATDKVGRTARRTADTHIRNALSKPRVSTTLRRMTAMFNFLPELPAIITDAGTPDLRAPAAEIPSPKITVRDSEHTPNIQDYDMESPREPTPPKLPQQEDSATESEDEGIALKKGTLASHTSSRHLRESGQPPSANLSKNASPAQPGRSRSHTKAPASESDSSPVRPTKKPKPPEDSDKDDSEEERRQRAAAIKSGTAAKRGTRQPLKRGGKRF